MSKILYKYLDVKGAAMMLHYHNLMFTNATKLNDPMDCHQDLIDFTHVPENQCYGWPPELIAEVKANPYLRTRETAYLCSLSKVHNSAQMWAYYTSNAGVCIGVDIEKVRKYYSRMQGSLLIGCYEYDVNYVDIHEKPDYFKTSIDTFYYQLTAKDKQWAHEQEVRIICFDPSPKNKVLLPGQNDKKGPIDWKEVHAFLEIGSECFDSMYLGIHMNKKERKRIIEIARISNPEMKIYQMKLDSRSLSLKEELVSFDL